MIITREGGRALDLLILGSKMVQNVPGPPGIVIEVIATQIDELRHHKHIIRVFRAFGGGNYAKCLECAERMDVAE
jgi:hypothetical protein